MIRKLAALALVLNGPLLLIQAAFRAVDLTRDDVVQIYNVPLETQPSSKFEWSVDRPSYFRVLVEEQVPGSEKWNVLQVYDYPAAQLRVEFIYTIDRQAAGQPNGWGFRFRTVGMSGAIRVTKVSSFVLPVSGNLVTARQKPGDPNRIFELSTREKEYRFRMEVSETPFAEPTNVR